jgi:hypothetical protein
MDDKLSARWEVAAKISGAWFLAQFDSAHEAVDVFHSIRAEYGGKVTEIRVTNREQERGEALAWENPEVSGMRNSCASRPCPINSGSR